MMERASLLPDQGPALLALSKANGLSVSAVIGRLADLHLYENLRCNGQ